MNDAVVGVDEGQGPLTCQRTETGLRLCFRPSRWEGLFQIGFFSVWSLLVAAFLSGAIQAGGGPPLWGLLGLFLVIGIGGFVSGMEKLFSNRYLAIEPDWIRYETWPVRFTFPRRLARQRVQGFRVQVRTHQRSGGARRRLTVHLYCVLEDGSLRRVMNLGRSLAAGQQARNFLTGQGGFRVDG